ncbi:MAG TPA: RDD family protein [Ilumatobacter sp.]
MTPFASPGRDVALQGHYAGAVTRLAAYVIDAATVSLLFAVGAGVVEFLLADVLGISFEIADVPLAATIALAVWSFLYFAVPLAASGRTFGSAILGLRVVRADGGSLDPKHAVIRVLAFPLSFLLFGLGFLLILVHRERRALHDLIAGTAVVYDWDARAARLRFLARAPGDAG